METALGLERVEACLDYKIGGRFPPGRCRKLLPKGATPAGSHTKPAKTVLGQTIEKKVAAPKPPQPKAPPKAPGGAAKQPAATPGTPALAAGKRVSARKLFAPKSQTEMKPVTDPAKLATLGDVFGVSHANMTSKIDKVSANGNRVAVTGIISGPDGKKIGSFETELRLDRRGGMFADLGLMEIAPEFQGQGFAREFNNKSLSWYRDSGMDRAQLLANIDVGALAWARAGWDWGSSFASGPLQQRLNKMAEGKDRKSAQLAKDMLARFDTAEFGTPAYPTAFELSEMGRTPGQGKSDTWPGKELFYSHPDPEHPDHLAWNAEIPFKGSRAVTAAAGPDRTEMINSLVAAHDQWVGQNLDLTTFEPQPDSKDFNLYYVDVDAAASAQDGLAKAMNAVLQGSQPTS